MVSGLRASRECGGFPRRLEGLHQGIEESPDDGFRDPAQKYGLGQFAQRLAAPVLRGDGELGRLCPYRPQLEFAVDRRRHRSIVFGPPTQVKGGNDTATYGCREMGVDLAAVAGRRPGQLIEGLGC